MAGETVSSQRQREENKLTGPSVDFLKRLLFHAARSQESRWTNLFYLFVEGLLLSTTVVIIIKLLALQFKWALDMPTIWFNVILYVSLLIFLQSFYTYQARGTMSYCLHLASYPYVKKNMVRMRRKSGSYRLDDPVWFIETRFNAIRRLVNRGTANHFEDMLSMALRNEGPKYSGADFNLIRSTFIIKLVRETLPLDNKVCWVPFEENEMKFIQQFQDRSPQPIELINYMVACYKGVPDEVRSYANDGKLKVEESISYRRERWFQVLLALITVAVPSILSLFL